MGTFTQPITLHASSGDHTEELDALVDTGATFTIVPAPILERLGVAPHRRVRLRLANGQSEERALAQIHRRDDYAAAERAIGAREGDGPGTIWGRGGPVSVFSCRGETL